MRSSAVLVFAIPNIDRPESDQEEASAVQAGGLCGYDDGSPLCT